MSSRILSLLLPLAAAGCPSDQDPSPDAQTEPSADAAIAPDTAPDAPAVAAVGLISIQDQSIHGAPQAGHGLSVRAEFSLPVRAPDFDEQPGELTGCKAWLHDVDDDPRPALLGDQGMLAVTGTGAAVPNGCVFDGAAYICPVVSATGVAASVTPMTAPTALYEVAGMLLTGEDVGRHLRIAGDRDRPANAGQFPILAAPGPSSALVVNPAATSSAFSADYTILAGAGAAGLPLDSPADPIRDDDEIVIGIEPGGRADFEFEDTLPIDPGDSFALDDSSAALLGAVPVDGRAFSLGCAGPGGRCGEAFVSIVQLETTDGSVAGGSPFAMPAPIDRTVVISCATPGEAGRVDVPAAAAQLLRIADQTTPITRIRVAFMRDGFALATNPAPLPPNPVRIVAGHQVVGFTTDPGSPSTAPVVRAAP
jgi:hypothetical protein